MAEIPAKTIESAALLEVWVVPGAAQTQIVGVHGSSVKVRVASRAEGGKANHELTRLLEEKLETGVRLVRGITSRRKVFEVSGVDADFIVRKLGLDL